MRGLGPVLSRKQIFQKFKFSSPRLSRFWNITARKEIHSDCVKERQVALFLTSTFIKVRTTGPRSMMVAPHIRELSFFYIVLLSQTFSCSFLSFHTVSPFYTFTLIMGYTGRFSSKLTLCNEGSVHYQYIVSQNLQQ